MAVLKPILALALGGLSAQAATLPRRLLLKGMLAGGALAAPAVSLAAGAPALGAMESVRSGERLFRSGDVDGSCAAFDAALGAEPRLAPYLWQRGISLYYAGQYAEAAAQFKRDVAVNPADVEEALWEMVASARISGLADARARLLVVGRDRRPVLRDVYALFASGDDAARARVEALAAGAGSDAFYARLYLGLLAEAAADEGAARRNIEGALRTQYAAAAAAGGDYMVAVARVHASRRGWTTTAVKEA